MTQPKAATDTIASGSGSPSVQITLSKEYNAPEMRQRWTDVCLLFPSLLRAFYFAPVLFMAGCASLKGSPESPRTIERAQADPGYLIDSVRLAHFNAAPTAQKLALRNEIIDERLLEIDHQFQAFSVELWRSETGSAVGVDWIQLALSGLTATIGGVATKAALGAASIGVGGARASFDKNVLFQKTLPAIMAQMVAEREKIRAQIAQRKQLPVTGYSLYAALSDIQHMINAGSIPGTIQVIAEDAGAKSAKAADILKSVDNAKFLKDDAGDQLRHFWKPDGKNIDKKNDVQLKTWMASEGLQTGPGSITMFLRSADMAALRVRAADELTTR